MTNVRLDFSTLTGYTNELTDKMTLSDLLFIIGSEAKSKSKLSKDFKTVFR